MCGNADIELSNMPRSFLVKKNNSYSHCPLKKRPLTYFLQQSEDDIQVESPLSDSSLMNDEEPENLSLKPEDRYLAAERERKRLLGNTEVYSPPAAHQESVKSCPSPLIEVKLSTGPLEPLNLNNYHQGSLYGLSRPSVTAVPYSYAPYLPFNLTTFNSYATQTPVPHYPISSIQHAEQLSPFAPRDSISPPGLSPATVTSTSPTSQTSDHSDVEDLSSPTLSPAKRRKTSATRFQCPDCHKSYSTYCGLTKHQELHCSQQTKKSFSCKHCDKVYVSLGALKMHIRTHTLPCKCMLCGKAFSRPWLLQGHIRTHTGEKPFSCQHCSRSFADRSNLRAHLQTHSDVKRYSCKACGKTFSRMSLLTKHEDGGCPGIVFKRDAA